MASLRNLLNPQSPRKACSLSSQQIETNDSNCSVSSSPSQSASRASTPDIPSSTFYPTYPTYPSNRPHATHENCPDSLDCLPDTDERPQHTLPVILRCAILGSARKRLTIRDIYSAMEQKYPYYKTAGPAWKQSVRHHLSLNRLFERQVKPVTEPGFGSYWTVNLDAPPGTKRPRKRGRQSKNAAKPQDEQPPRRGRPSKTRTEGSDYELEPETPSIGTLPIPPHNSTPHYRQYVMRPSPLIQRHDDDEELMEVQEVHDVCVGDPSVLGSDDAFESSDEATEDRSVWASSFDHRIFPPSPPRSLPETAMRPSNGHCTVGMTVEQLQKEVRELRRKAEQSTAMAARMADELSEAHAEIARLRVKNEFLERGISADLGQRYR